MSDSEEMNHYISIPEKILKKILLEPEKYYAVLIK